MCSESASEEAHGYSKLGMMEEKKNRESIFIGEAVPASGSPKMKNNFEILKRPKVLSFFLSDNQRFY